jgi:hypothetical protein
VVERRVRRAQSEHDVWSAAGAGIGWIPIHELLGAERRAIGERRFQDLEQSRSQAQVTPRFRHLLTRRKEERLRLSQVAMAQARSLGLRHDERSVPHSPNRPPRLPVARAREFQLPKSFASTRMPSERKRIP